MAAVGGHHSARAQTVDWLTPPEIVGALGPFDLDPCACNPMPWVTAPLMYSPPLDGFAMPWFGRVWLNPPYGREVFKWVKKLADHGNGICIIFARTDTAGFHEQVWNRADAILFMRGRLKFYRPNGKQAKANSGGPSCLVAYGAENATALVNSGIEGMIVYPRPA